MNWINKSWVKRLYLPIEKITRLIPDKLYLKLVYRIRMGKKLDLKNPQTFSEKLQWLKLHDRKPIYTTMVDKYEAKKYVAERIGEQYIIPTLGVWNHFDEIDFDKLPDQFVLKCTHDSGGLVIVRDKKKFDRRAAKKKIEGSLKRNFYWKGREWPYKNVEPRIIAEKYIEDPNGSLRDYKFFCFAANLPVYKFLCFSGEPIIIQTIQNDKTKDETIDYFDLEWNLLDLRQNYENSNTPLPKPNMLHEMIDVAKKLSKGHLFIRIDLYQANEKVLFSEFTFFSDAGFEGFRPPEWDTLLGEKINLSLINNNRIQYWEFVR